MTLQVPDTTRLSAVQALCEIRDPYTQSPEVDRLFVEAMRQNVAWHLLHSEFYRRLAEQQDFSPDSLSSMADMARVPFIHANFFKTHEIMSIPREQVALHLTSSGTTGQKSQMFFDAWSIGAGRRMVDAMYERLGLVSETPANYLLNSYEPLPDMSLGTANTTMFLTKYAPPARVTFALRSKGDGAHEFDPFGSVEALRSYAEEGLPVRIIGFPAFLYFTLQRYIALGYPKLTLHPDSFVFVAGGWKGHANQEIKKAELYSLIREWLGIPDARIRSSFGSVEHSIPYIECPHHNLHVPIWSKVYVRDVKTLAVNDYGQPGFLQFVSPYITSVPAQGVLMGDLALLHPAERCGCGIDTEYFEILGRAGTSTNKSCAAAAAELLK
ncbi:Acyl-protein synthetase, LuxE [compost metagenome]